MNKLFTHENRMIVYNMRNLLQSEGIETVVRNEFSGGGVGDLPAFDTWPELWLRDDSQLTRAMSILQCVTTDNDAAPWVCQGCGEANGTAFQLCWSCGRALDEVTDHDD
jgi:hypothetical protein